MNKTIRKLEGEDDLYTDLTERQEEVLSYLENCIADGLPPTHAEIAKHFGWKSPNAAAVHIRALEKKGRLEPGNGRRRFIRPLTPDEDARPE